MSYRVIEQLQQKAAPVTHLCKLLQVSRSGYYTAHRVRSNRAHLRCERTTEGRLCRQRPLLWLASAASEPVSSRATHWPLSGAQTDEAARPACGLAAQVCADDR